MTTPNGTRAFMVATALVLGAAAAGTWAQSQTPATGSLAALTEEVHQLRLTVQESARNQVQTQAIAVALSAQQSRLIQSSARLDKAHADATAATASAQQLASQLAAAQAELPRVTTQEERDAANYMIRMRKEQTDRAQQEEMQVRAREAELVSAMQAEEARWLELVARLEALMKR